MRILYLLQVILLISCQSAPSGASKVVEEEPLDSSTFNQTTLLFPEKGSKSQKLTFSITFPEITGGQAVEDLVNAALYEGDAPQAYADKLHSSYVEQYEAIKAIAGDSESANWYYTEETQVLTEAVVGTVNKPLLQIKRRIETYTGGAHPSHNTQFYVFDTRTSRRLSIEDVVQDVEALTQIAEAALVDKHVESLPDNFFLTEQGIGFHWNEYEIAPYSEGEIETVVSYDAIENLEILK
ncbi:MAG: DUF3298 and DUF4163 domain-containing protein [Treponema sp.]|jgi:hypothetical protein|nr:DUF3298 and DUF4163 domain-containing protein [Treponema sp.]